MVARDRGAKDNNIALVRQRPQDKYVTFGPWLVIRTKSKSITRLHVPDAPQVTNVSLVRPRPQDNYSLVNDSN